MFVDVAWQPFPIAIV
jgi:hypothetical protein